MEVTFYFGKEKRAKVSQVIRWKGVMDRVCKKDGQREYVLDDLRKDLCGWNVEKGEMRLQR